jgi:ribosomal protein S18 acetylase RimI-like enzyme
VRVRAARRRGRAPGGSGGLRLGILDVRRAAVRQRGNDLAVLPEFQSRGLGTRLLDEVERRARARGCCKITLEVHETNHGARRLYERFGFGPWRSPTLFVTKPLGRER